MTKLSLNTHLTTAELANRLSMASKPYHRTYWQILLSISFNPNHEASEYASFLAVKPSLIIRIVNKYNALGADSIETSNWGGRRKGRTLLSLEEESEMMKSIEIQASTGHVLTMHDIRSIVVNKVGKEVSDDYLWDLFKRHNWKKKMPRPEHPKGDKASQEDFKKNFMTSWIPTERDPKTVDH